MRVFLLCLLTLPCHAAEMVEMPIYARIISFADAAEQCASDEAPEWCPEHLKEPVTEIEFTEEFYEWINSVEPASGEDYE